MSRSFGVGTYLARARGTLTILRQWPGQRRVPYLPPERLLELRDRRVRSLVAFAAEHVPHYRELFRREGIDPRELRSADDLVRLPLLDKAALQADPERFRPDTPDRDEVVAFPTAGSRGQPVRVLHDRRSLLAIVALGERERVVEVGFCGSRYGYDVLQVTHPETSDRRTREFFAEVSYRPLRPRLHFLTVADPPETVIAALNRIRPPVVRGFGSHLDLVFRTALARGLEVHRPRVVVYGGDAMPESGKRLLEDELGVPVISRYGACEAFMIGFTCEARDGFHLHEDLTHVSVVGADGRPAADGERGEIVLANLVNRGFVLLNYRLGDVGRLGGRACPCGRTARLLTELEGRVDETLRLPDGRLVHWVLPRVAMDQPGVLRFQLVHESPDRFRLRLVTVDAETYERLAPKIAGELRAVLAGCTVEVERRDELRPDRGRKFRPIVPLARNGDG